VQFQYDPRDVVKQMVTNASNDMHHAEKSPEMANKLRDHFFKIRKLFEAWRQNKLAEPALQKQLDETAAKRLTLAVLTNSLPKSFRDLTQLPDNLSDLVQIDDELVSESIEKWRADELPKEIVDPFSKELNVKVVLATLSLQEKEETIILGSVEIIALYKERKLAERSLEKMDEFAQSAMKTALEATRENKPDAYASFVAPKVKSMVEANMRSQLDSIKTKRLDLFETEYLYSCADRSLQFVMNKLRQYIFPSTTAKLVDALEVNHKQLRKDLNKTHANVQKVADYSKKVSGTVQAVADRVESYWALSKEIGTSNYRRLDRLQEEVKKNGSNTTVQTDIGTFTSLGDNHGM